MAVEVSTWPSVTMGVEHQSPFTPSPLSAGDSGSSSQPLLLSHELWLLHFALVSLDLPVTSVALPWSSAGWTWLAESSGTAAVAQLGRSSGLLAQGHL